MLTTYQGREVTARDPIEHGLPCFKAAYRDFWRGARRAVLLRDHGDFRVNDWLRIREYDPVLGDFSGHWQLHRITHVARAEDAVAPGFALLSVPGFALLSVSECLAKEKGA